MTEHTEQQTLVKQLKSKGFRIPKFAKHRNGQFYCTKRIFGIKKFFYFGKDEEAAKTAFLDALPDIVMGRQPETTRPISQVTVLELTDRFIVAQEERFRAGDIGIRQFDDLRNAAMVFRDWAQEQRPVDEIPPLEGLRTSLKSKMRLSSFNRYITGIRKMLRWGYKRKPHPLLAVALHEDDALSKAKNKHVKRERREIEAEQGKPIFSPEEVRALLLRCNEIEEWNMMTFILLGINAGMGQSHISELIASAINPETRYVDWVRTKTEELFQVVLWPITVEAINKTIANRASAAKKEFGGLLFRTRLGFPWVQVYYKEENGVIGRVAPNDEIGKRFREIEKTVKVGSKLIHREGRSFYALRRTFATLANDVPDKDSIRRIMGHALQGMDPHYVRQIPIERLEAVTNYVHHKILGCTPDQLTLANLKDKLTTEQPG